MKKLLLTTLVVFPLFVSAQNIQLHYDFGKPQNSDPRNFFIGTLEYFRPDTLGYTFLFVDFVFDSPNGQRGVSLGYFEISREFYMPWFKNNKSLRELGLHIEYNDGSLIYQIPGDSVTYGENINSAWLGGLGYPVKLGNFTLNTMLLYKHIRESSAPDFQLTFAWFHMLFNKRLTVAGFIDVWSQDDLYGNPKEKVAVLFAQPQFWFNFTSHFSVGSEIQISKNFIPGSERYEIFPTLAVKWSF